MREMYSKLPLHVDVVAHFLVHHIHSNSQCENVYLYGMESVVQEISLMLASNVEEPHLFRFD